MKVLITGGAGFVGSQLARELVRNNEVVLLDNMSAGYLDNISENGRPLFDLQQRDVRDRNLDDVVAGTDTIVHLAGTSSLPTCQSSPADAFDNNVTGVLNILEHGRRHGVRRIIFSSTSAVYENCTEPLFSETLRVAPDLAYSSSKHVAEQCCQAMANTYGIDVIIARFFNVYGEHQDIHRRMPPFVSYLAKETFYGRTPVLYNNTDARRDYVYITDVIDCLVRMMNAPGRYSGDVFNICSGVGYSVKEIVAEYATIARKPIVPEYRDPAQFWDVFPEIFQGQYPFRRERIVKEVHKNSVGDGSKARLAFGFAPKVGLREGLERVHRFAEKQLA